MWILKCRTGMQEGLCQVSPLLNKWSCWIWKVLVLAVRDLRVRENGVRRHTRNGLLISLDGSETSLFNNLGHYYWRVSVIWGVAVNHQLRWGGPLTLSYLLRHVHISVGLALFTHSGFLCHCVNRFFHSYISPKWWPAEWVISEQQKKRQRTENI